MGRIFEVRKHTMFARWDRMSKQFARLGKEITIAVKRGGPSPDRNPPVDTGSDMEREKQPMYDMYPEWGPARNHPDSQFSQQAVQAALDLRDNGGERPDDN